ncbi:hypothetical protein OIU79_009762 [Salix purpurea]|uniref:Uncharacterized protein n=1 Tax=Salix purpurea TaxID=77065 RepID=A0A9Q0QED3_SALPP|nr:hypothetical protein OIU79_009762 [Salix purpurea]
MQGCPSQASDQLLLYPCWQPLPVHYILKHPYHLHCLHNNQTKQYLQPVVLPLNHSLQTCSQSRPWMEHAIPASTFLFGKGTYPPISTPGTAPILFLIFVRTCLVIKIFPAFRSARLIIPTGDSLASSN